MAYPQKKENNIRFEIFIFFLKLSFKAKKEKFVRLKNGKFDVILYDEEKNLKRP